jgi:hypothetical protein
MTEPATNLSFRHATMDFTCVGIDVRQWPWRGSFNADETGWERNEPRFSELKAALGLWQNEYQLLEVGSEQLSDADRLVSSWPDCALLAVEYPSEIVRLRDSRLRVHTASFRVESNRFTCRGLDVCDFNGLFSVLHHPEIASARGGTHLFEPGELLPALQVLQFANVLDPSHAPFAIARLWSSK